MSIIYHQMKYNSRENKYIISKLEPKSSVDTTKVNEVIQLSSKLWVARRKQDLIDLAEEMKATKIAEYRKMISLINRRVIEV